MKTSKKISAICLTIAILICVVVPALAENNIVAYTNDFSYGDDEMRADTNLNWTEGARFTLENGKLVNNSVNLWTATGFNKILGKNDLSYKAQVDLSIPQELDPKNKEQALAIGVRVAGSTNLFIDSGLWFMLKQNSLTVSLASNRAQSITITGLGVDFKKERTIFIEDDINEIRLYANDDAKQKILLATVILSADKFVVKDGENTEKGSCPMSYALGKKGYFRIMPHYVTCTVDNLKVAYQEMDLSLGLDPFTAFDFTDSTSTENVMGTGTVPDGNYAIRFNNDGVIEFDNVNFDNGAQYMEITTSGGYNGAFMNVYIDGLSGIGILKEAIVKANMYELSPIKQYYKIEKTQGKHKLSIKVRYSVAGRWPQQFESFRFFKEKPDGYEEITQIPENNIIRDLFADTWVGNDDLDRKLPIGEEVPAPRQDKKVIAFYFIWSSNQNPGDVINDNSKALLENPENPNWGTGSGSYWGKPYFGYYTMKDEWVIRRHAQMLYEAGVDAIACDVSNWVTYDDTLFLLFDAYAKMRAEGNPTPQITLFLPSGGEVANDSAHHLYNLIYKNGLYKDLWFKLKSDKPFLIGEMSQLDDEMKNFFEFRSGNAWSAGKDSWGWINDTPQSLAWHDDISKPEEISVRMASHPTRNIGRSNVNNVQPAFTTPFATDITTSGLGLHYQEQFDYAFTVDPEVIFLTGFNEWGAGRTLIAAGQTGEAFLGRATGPGDTTFVDTFSPEYSRDFEPVNGSFYDNYYYQTAQNVRKFKGARRQFIPSEKKTIDLSGDFSQWDNVFPEYRDYINDDTARESTAVLNMDYYENLTGRNDIEATKVSRDDENLYFYVRCSEKISKPQDNWMTLYLNTDRKYKNGWQGYDYVINHKAGKLEKFNNGWNFSNASDVSYKVNGREMMITVPRTALGLNNIDELTIDFKWADNSQNDGNVYDFMTLGDVAPDNRFNYRFTEGTTNAKVQVINDGYVFDRNAETTVSLKNKLLKNTVIMKLENSGGFVNQNFVQSDCAPLVVNGSALMPLRYMAESLGAGVDWNQAEQKISISYGTIDKYDIQMWIGNSTMKVNGVNVALDSPPIISKDRTMVPLRAVSEALGKEVMYNPENKIIIIGSKDKDYESMNQNNDLMNYIASKFDTAKFSIEGYTVYQSGADMGEVSFNAPAAAGEPGNGAFGTGT